METLLYLGEVSLYWILLYACYWLMLRNHTFFVWNRYYLIGSLFAAFSLPLLIYPDTAPTLPAIYEVNAADFTFSAFEPEQTPLLSWVQAIWIIYGVGLIIGIYNFINNFSELKGYLSAGELIELDDCKVVIMDSNHIGSFSFMKWIVINRNDYENHFDAILRHEMVHTSQWHSIDILIVEILRAVFWFNPVLLLYKYSLQEVHEYLADSQAPNREHYAKFLVAYALNAPIASITNHFFKPSQIKSRIQMIYKNRSSKWLLSTYIMAFCLIGTIALIIAGCEGKIVSEPDFTVQTESNSNKIIVPENPRKVFTVVEEQPEFPGGISAMYEFIGNNMNYPEAAIKANVEGRVFLSFVVTETGTVEDILVLKGLGYGCDAEAVRVLSKFPKWTPGKQNGMLVNVRYNLPINFQLEEKDDKDNVSSRIKLDKPMQDLVDLAFSPLYILDGKEMANGKFLQALPKDDIQSMSVLKDQSAIDAYGARGKNGVISIITK
jgi:TonB family protein